MTRIDVTRNPFVRSMLVSRWPQLVVTLVALAVFVVAIVSGLLGTPVGNRNFSIIAVWIAWWGLLILLAVPLVGRGWCSICPIPAPGEWLQRGAVLRPLGRGFGLNWRWPRRLRGIWIQNLAFALLCLFSLVILTTPRVTGWILAAFLLLALATSLIFERRAFCRYLCPVGGFIGLYSQVAPVELRVKDPAICVSHAEKTCYQGNSEGYGCPWQAFPLGLTKNTACGLCLECLRTCPKDNIALNLRPPGADLAVSSHRRMDEAFKGLIMLGSALVYSAVMLGPWGSLKGAAFGVGSRGWLVYASGLLTVLFGVLPALFLMAVALGRRWSGSTLGLRKAFVAEAYSLVPLGLAAWIAFSLAFFFASVSYVPPILSDPLGLGWNLFGTAGIAWQPFLMQVVPFLQIAVLVAGLGWAVVTARRIAAEQLAPRAARRMTLPVGGFSLAVTLGLIGLLIA
jgi:hypothetical protein